MFMAFCYVYFCFFINRIYNFVPRLNWFILLQHYTIKVGSIFLFGHGQDQDPADFIAREMLGRSQIKRLWPGLDKNFTGI